jgi:hypothetical protein
MILEEDVTAFSLFNIDSTTSKVLTSKMNRFAKKNPRCWLQTSPASCDELEALGVIIGRRGAESFRFKEG